MKFTTADISARQTFRDIASLYISSPEFETNGFIPPRYTCDGPIITPPIDFYDFPATTKSLALIADDPDAPIRSWVHWLAWNIPVTAHIKEDISLKEQGLNDFRENKYCGPCPPYGTHRYFFKVYALDKRLQLPAKTSKTELEKAMQGHV